ncbi:MAG: hypothetical protein RL153_266, partial [Verrucomicrobiota bacterium]
CAGRGPGHCRCVPRGIARPRTRIGSAARCGAPAIRGASRRCAGARGRRTPAASSSPLSIRGPCTSLPKAFASGLGCWAMAAAVDAGTRARPLGAVTEFPASVSASVALGFRIFLVGGPGSSPWHMVSTRHVTQRRPSEGSASQRSSPMPTRGVASRLPPRVLGCSRWEPRPTHRKRRGAC